MCLDNFALACQSGHTTDLRSCALEGGFLFEEHSVVGANAGLEFLQIFPLATPSHRKGCCRSALFATSTRWLNRPNTVKILLLLLHSGRLPHLGSQVTLLLQAFSLLVRRYTCKGRKQLTSWFRWSWHRRLFAAFICF